MLSGDCTVVQAPGLDGLSFNPFSFQEDGPAAPEVDVGRCQIGDGLVVTLMVVMIDEGIDLSLEIAGQIVVCEIARNSDPVRSKNRNGRETSELAGVG